MWITFVHILDSSTGVDTPFFYSSKILTGKNGVILKGTNTLNRVDKNHKVRYELIKKGFWSEKVYDGADVKSGEPFFVELHAPQGEGYQIKVNGYGEISHGNLLIMPY